MKILFVGSVVFSEKILKQLIYLKANIVGVCTLKSSEANSDFCDLKAICEEFNIPAKYTNDINSDQSIAWIGTLNPDIIFCFGWSRLLKKKLLNLAPMGVVGYHPASIPNNRGRHPIIWSLVLGLKETSSTFFFMDEGADSVDILSQVSLPILYEDDATSLYNKLISIAISQISDFLPLLEKNKFKRIPQDHSLSNYWRKRNINDGKIDWRMSSESIYNLIRGLTWPYPGAHFEYNGNQYKAWKSKVILKKIINIEPGKIISASNDGIIVKTGDNLINLTKIEPEIDIVNGSYL